MANPDSQPFTGPAGSTWAGSYDYRATAFESPTTIDELQSLVAAAPQVRALGSRHSFTDLADSPGLLVSLEKLDVAIELDEATRTVTVGAGVRYGDLATVLQARGFALHNLASLPHISIAGAVATGTHGSGDRNGTLATAVAALELVTATGELLRVDRNDRDFDGMVVALGALGVVSRITLDIEPTFDVAQTVYPKLDLDLLERDFDDVSSAAYSVSVFTDWGETGDVWLKSRVGVDVVPDHVLGAAAAQVERHMIDDMPSVNTTTQGGVPGPWNDRLAHFKLGFTPSSGEELQSEYLVPRRFAVEAIQAMRSIASDIQPLLQISEIRTMRADGLWLSGAYGTDAVGLHFTWIKDAQAVAALLPAIEAALAPFDARAHWGKVLHSIRPELYPRLGDFIELARGLDPDGKFRNAFLERTVFAER